MAQTPPKPTSSGSERFLFCMFAISLSFIGPATAAPGEAQAIQATASMTLSSRFQPGSIQSEEHAEQALSETGRERAAIASRFAADERICLDRFFVNSCVEDAKERQRHALAEVRRIEVEANALLRRLRVEERDRALLEKRIEQERKEAGRLKEAAPPADSEAAVGTSGQESIHAAPEAEISSRQARHEAKLKRIEEKERAQAQKRADKVASYERKVIEAQKRRHTAQADVMNIESK